MHATATPFRTMPPLAAAVATSLAAAAGSVAWAFAMRRECDRWTRSGRRLDGDAIRGIADRLNT